jgi:DNA-directed RNA polymerase subunit RPC12/RpoP
MPDDRDTGAAWKRNPLVGCAAGAVVLITLISLLSRIDCGGTRYPTPNTAETLTLVCRECNHAWEVTRNDVGATEQDEEEGFRIKAEATPCPTCGAQETTVAFFCRKCGKPFAPPVYEPGTEPDPFRCPHCGKDPFHP